MIFSLLILLIKSFSANYFHQELQGLSLRRGNILEYKILEYKIFSYWFGDFNVWMVVWESTISLKVYDFGLHGNFCHLRKVIVPNASKWIYIYVHLQYIYL